MKAHVLSKLFRWIACCLSLAALNASAVFHLWELSEVYSNADGTIQFLEARALAGGQQFVAGHTLRSSSGGTVNTFVFPHNLPGDSAGRTFLVGTQGFAALNIVQPDYVVENGFFFQQGGSINFAEGADVWTHPALPTDGAHSLNRDGSAGLNTPTNFMGLQGSIPTAPSLNFQALWWGGPAESGWGVNITHQGDILFATWFTYDTDGRGMWLVVPHAGRSGSTPEGGPVYSGTLYRTTGPAFNSEPFDVTRVGLTPVGTGIFAFTDANNGRFTYTVNGFEGSKAITRQVFASPLPECTAGGPMGFKIYYQDLWWRAPAGSESGWGVNITHQGDILFATWFTYDTDGRGLWLVMPRGERSASNALVYSGQLFRTRGPRFDSATWNPGNVVATPVGTATFTFTTLDENSGSFAYTVNGISQVKSITRQVFEGPVTVCR